MSSTELNQDFFELGDRTSIICADPATTDIVRSCLRELGFKIHFADSEEGALDRIRYTQYNCIVIHENFAGSILQTNAVIQYLAPLPMNMRRASFICLIGDSFNTLDAMQAFAQSVHVVVNPSDLPNLTAILKKGLAEFEMAYRVYRISMDSQGERRPARRSTDH
jgi:CheY-like chemotaxis protein